MLPDPDKFWVWLQQRCVLENWYDETLAELLWICCTQKNSPYEQGTGDYWSIAFNSQGLFIVAL
jgi:hypothetical protein